jgi:hypothetical protein
LILLSGIFLAVRVGVHAFAWVRISFGAMVLMSIIGGPLIRSRVRAIARDEGSEVLRQHAADPLLRISIRTRIALGLAIIFLMIAKVGVAGSLVAMCVALLAGLITSVYDARPAAETTSGNVY